MRLSKILSNIEVLNKYNDVDISNISIDTRRIKSDGLFFCINGENIDGHDLAQEAMYNGAKCLVVERKLDLNIQQILVKSTREAVSICAGNFYGNPRTKFKLIGITGTNGKTTSTYMIKNILQLAGYKVGVIGTIGVMIDEQSYPATLTTPDPIDLHKIFAKMADKKVDIVVMEVSAHAIALNKMAGIVCDIGVLTNVTQDHLDYFKTFKSYANTKKSFINPKFCKVGVVNVDDEIARELVLKNDSKFKIKTFGLNNPADCFAVNINYYFNGTTYFLNNEYDLNVINTRLIGEFNIYNALGAACVCSLLGINSKTIQLGLNTMDFVPGRINVLPLKNNAYAVVDYAHTPDGLENILTSVRKISKGRVISLFGCGGNRDSSKREIMGEISAKLADFTIITSDNPRFEEPESIIKQVEKGVKSISTNYKCITDRKEAIIYALNNVRENDVIVIAGKGAENYLDIKGEKIQYSDFEVINEYKQEAKEASR